MMLTEGKFTVDRQRLVAVSMNIISKIAIQVAKDITLGGEYILTAENLLETMGSIPAFLLNEELPQGYTGAHYSIVTVIYKQP
jgi:hypothetical protein